MQSIFQNIVGRFIGRVIGLNVRYLFFRLSGKHIAYSDLKTPIINKSNDYDERGLQQDTYNALVGVTTILLAVVIFRLRRVSEKDTAEL